MCTQILYTSHSLPLFPSFIYHRSLALQLVLHTNRPYTLLYPHTLSLVRSVLQPLEALAVEHTVADILVRIHDRARVLTEQFRDDDHTRQTVSL